MKLIDIHVTEMKLPKGYAPMLTCGELEHLFLEHLKEDKKLKFVIKIYEMPKGE